MSEVQTPDEIVASNLEHRRKERDMSVAELADRLNVSRGHVYNMLPREDRPQREFRWRELVDLCQVLDVTLYELVLPREDVRMWVLGGQAWSGSAKRAGLKDGLHHDELVELLFGFGYAEGWEVIDKALNHRVELARQLQTEMDKLAVHYERMIGEEDEIRRFADHFDLMDQPYRVVREEYLKKPEYYRQLMDEEE